MIDTPSDDFILANLKIPARGSQANGQLKKGKQKFSSSILQFALGDYR